MSNEIPAEVSIKSGGGFRLRRLWQKWPLLVWIGMLALVVYLYSQRGTFGRVNGMVTANSEEIAPLENGVILTVHVTEGEEITKGQPLVTLDPGLLTKQIEELEQTLVIDRLERARRFQDNLASARDRLLQVEQSQLQDQAELEAAEASVAGLREQLRVKRITADRVTVAEGARDALRRRVGSYGDRITQANADVTAAQQLVEQLGAVDNAANAGAEPKALSVLKQRLADKTLVAPANGTVQKIFKMRGVAQTGEPILNLLLKDEDSNTPTKMVRGFIPQKESPEKIQPGDLIWVAQREAGPTAYQAKVISVAPDITAVPNFSTPVQGQFLRGREFLAELPGDLGELLPGTGVQIYREEPNRFDIWSFGKKAVRSAGN